MTQSIAQPLCDSWACRILFYAANTFQNQSERISFSSAFNGNQWASAARNEWETWLHSVYILIFQCWIPEQLIKMPARSLNILTCFNMFYKKLGCRRETARRFVSLNISLSHPRSLKVIWN